MGVFCSLKQDNHWQFVGHHPANQKARATTFSTLKLVKEKAVNETVLSSGTRELHLSIDSHLNAFLCPDSVALLGRPLEEIPPRENVFRNKSNGGTARLFVGEMRNTTTNQNVSLHHL